MFTTLCFGLYIVLVSRVTFRFYVSHLNLGFYIVLLILLLPDRGTDGISQHHSPPNCSTPLEESRRCPDRHASAPAMQYIGATRTIISKLAEPECTSQDAALCADLLVRMHRRARIYESGCSVVRGFTTQDAALFVDLRIRILHGHCTAVHCTCTTVQT